MDIPQSRAMVQAIAVNRIDQIDQWSSHLTCNDLNIAIRMLPFSSSPRPHLEQSRNIHRFLKQQQCFFFALRREHGHAVGEFVTFGADMPGNMTEREFAFYPSVDCVTVLNKFQIPNLAATFGPASLFPAGRPKTDAVDGVS